AHDQRFLDDVPPPCESLHFAGWSIADFVTFHERCSAPGFVTPFNAERDRLVEDWVLCSLGEFVYFAMPELAPEVRTHLADVCARVPGPRYYNVQILPPGYDPPAGRYRDPSGTVIWGNYAWRADRRTGQ
ncbi:MAG TPA: hypothetical protein VE258_02420, partial [Ktedonobacterales bacterium]|nr:hypothetical protein [Ktedonobacterales bacterium]